MILFGQVKNIRVEDTKQIKHLAVKKFIPVYEREGECYTREKGFHIGKKYLEESGWWSYAGIAKNNSVWAIERIRRQRQGQLRLLFLGESVE